MKLSLRRTLVQLIKIRHYEALPIVYVCGKAAAIFSSLPGFSRLPRTDNCTQSLPSRLAMTINDKKVQVSDTTKMRMELKVCQQNYSNVILTV
jgi:hypothetical protein